MTPSNERIDMCFFTITFLVFGLTFYNVKYCVSFENAAIFLTAAPSAIFNDCCRTKSGLQLH